MASTPHGTSMDAVMEAEAAHDALMAALDAAGIVLPSLGIDAVSCAHQFPRPLIELGRCNVETARKLADALTGAGHGRERGVTAP